MSGPSKSRTPAKKMTASLVAGTQQKKVDAVLCLLVENEKEEESRAVKGEARWGFATVRTFFWALELYLPKEGMPATGTGMTDKLLDLHERIETAKRKILRGEKTLSPGDRRSLDIAKLSEHMTKKIGATEQRAWVLAANHVYELNLGPDFSAIWERIKEQEQSRLLHMQAQNERLRFSIIVPSNKLGFRKVMESIRIGLAE